MNAHPNSGWTPSSSAASPAAYPRARIPSRMHEYGYYLSIFYTVMSPALGLSVGLFGAAFLTVVAVLCFIRVGAKARVVYAPLLYPLGCSISSLLVQIVFYGESILANESRSFVTWMLALVIAQSLALRPGFLHRFAVAFFFIGMCMLPFLQVSGASLDVDRFRLDSSVGFSNPNDLAAFFGFCFLYFIIASLETRRLPSRLAYWLAATVSLYVVSLTVSRGPLFAIGVAACVGGRHLLKRGFVPILLLFLVAWFLYLSGLFDQAIASYQGRLTEETGRLLVWPLVLERFWDSPWFGVGIADLGTYVGTKAYTPHNAFLYVALSWGVVPMLFLVAYWWQSGRAALSKAHQSSRDGLFQAPLWVYAFLVNFQLNNTFMAPWSVVILACAMSPEAGQFLRSFQRRLQSAVRPLPEPQVRQPKIDLS